MLEPLIASLVMIIAQSPPGCSVTQAGIGVYGYSEAGEMLPLMDSVFEGQPISLRIALGTAPVQGLCNNIGGQLTLGLPSGELVPLDGHDGHPRIVEYGSGAPPNAPIHWTEPVPYVVNNEDAVQIEGMEGWFIVATAYYGATGETPWQANGWSMTEPPQPLGPSMTQTWLRVVPQITCTGDVNVDGQVDAGDLLAVIGVFGVDCPGCAQDVTGDGVVNVSDVLAVIGGWGACP